ncbi:hypothetical protein ACFW1A_25140, partial [Kitasatospora sp. NPDC058965]|uniref:hypothetical protein n=1 Tax=Kitasatospora sp. NPDC058965 TaxID=3346682 RepID=UPI0036C10D48
LTFGTLLSSQGTDASFELISQPSGLRSFVFPAYQIRRTAFSDFRRWSGPLFCFRGDRHSTVFPDQVRTMLNPRGISEAGKSVNVMVAPLGFRALLAAALLPVRFRRLGQQ